MITPREQEFACVAQSVEQRLCNPQVIGSNPVTGSKIHFTKGWISHVKKGYKYRAFGVIKCKEDENPLDKVYNIG